MGCLVDLTIEDGCFTLSCPLHFDLLWLLAMVSVRMFLCPMYLKSQTHSSRTFLSPFPSPLEHKHAEAMPSEDVAFALGLFFFLCAFGKENS